MEELILGVTVALLILMIANKLSRCPIEEAVKKIAKRKDKTK
jgi:hypothetical protein